MRIACASSNLANRTILISLSKIIFKVLTIFSSANFSFSPTENLNKTQDSSAYPAKSEQTTQALRELNQNLKGEDEKSTSSNALAKIQQQTIELLLKQIKQLEN